MVLYPTHPSHFSLIAGEPWFCCFHQLGEQGTGGEVCVELNGR